ncbi:PAN2-PAN3 deadenylation complex catalytic subunit PAN2-like [Porites lutea]|uniref:PAN2-PAN3 deadenylation complex catalytic subunit PAN2-like n=1 Tax=Porites lutea TaxID=51062 RepID=UPI003CC5091A
MELNHGGAVVREEYQEIRSVFNNRDHSGISAVIFDPLEELVWTGNQSGYLASYFGPELQKYTSFKVHHEEIRHVTANDHGILSLSCNELCFSSRPGLRVFRLSGTDLSDLQCMLQGDETHLWVAGHQNLMLEVDLKKGLVSNKTEVEPGTVVMKQSARYLCCGDTAGKVRLRDPSSLTCEHVLDAHTGTLSDFDVSGNLLVTCGFCSRMGRLAVDRFLMVYDLRTLRALPPLQIAVDPLMLKFVPALTSRVAVVSQNGQFQLHEPGGLVTQSSMMVYQVNTQGTLCTTFDISATCQSMVFGDAGGNTHLWGETQEKEIIHNLYSRPTEFAHPIPHLPPLHIDDYTVPLSAFPLPMPNGPLLSDWPEENMVAGDRRTPAIEPEILRTMVVRHFIGYAPNPGNRKRNQVAYPVIKDSVMVSPEEENTVPDSPMNRDEDPGSIIPKHYRRVEIRYSKLGVEDFDFKHYNRTSFAGLETHIPNAYCNAMLQLFYFVEPLRAGFQNHLCHREFCLACELGFLFQMLDMSSGQTCQANNFLRAFRTIPEAAALGLVLNDVDESFGNANFPRLIQSWFRFVLQQMHQDTLEPPASSERENEDSKNPTGKSQQSSIIQRLFGSDVELLSRCRCGKETKRVSNTLLFNLEYPEMPEDKIQQPVSFESVLLASMCREQSMQAWCEQCSRYQPTVQTRKVKKLPDILAFNCGMEHAKEVDVWKMQQQLLDPPSKGEEKPTVQSSTKACRYGDACTRPDCKFRHERDVNEEGRIDVQEEEEVNGWVPLAIKISTDSTGMRITKIDENQKVKCSENEVVYDLLATVGHVQDLKSGGNLVAHIHVGTTYHSRKEGVTCSQWYLFNDFAITPISPNDAVHYSLDWKIPCAVVFTRRDINSRHETTINQRIDDGVLYQDVSLVRRGSVSREFTPLGVDELPNEGDLVGLDAEFVTLNQEEAEIRSDGTRSTIKPSQMSVARVTVVRGEGPLAGVPFIDDYISTTEQVVDYLTKFSGIKPGDLDATMSSKHLTTLKTTYRKLRALVARKVKFVGHGLKKDFRVINILVPKEQVFDTVELFHLPRQRYISLRFLAWYFLGLTIQSETHDSTEDANTALQLYRKYEELNTKGEFRKVLRQLYEDGRKSGWKVGEPATTE